ncbi:MAG: peptidoglycan bridge formation glycyltransferase FemA/FemB family protein [Candidatus Aureabacteria bacterium]|nr:peptidoglycan bridge formation glycyltransferase FemA/FemB family protein [Candidatus Auribacterota bacterium]
MKIILLEETHKEIWDKFVKESDDAWFFHLYDWIKLNKEVWHYETFSFFVENDQGEILAIFPLFLEKQRTSWFMPLRYLTTGFGSANPALKPGLGKEQQKKILVEIFKHIDNLAKKIKVDCFFMQTPPLVPNNRPNRLSNVNPYIFYGLEDLPNYTYMLDLSQDMEKIFSNMSHAFRKNIKHAEKNGITVGKVETFSEMEEYYKLHVNTYRRTGVKPHPFKYFELIWKYFGEKGLVNIFYAQHEGEKIDFINLASLKEGLKFWTKCSLSSKRHLRSDSLVVYHIFKWAKMNGYKWIDIGEVFPNADPKSKLFGIYRYKKGMGGTIYPRYKARKIYSPMKMQLKVFASSVKKHFKKA